MGDPSGKDSLHIAEMVKELKQLEYINAFLILFNAQNPRLDESLRAMIDIFTQIFGRERFFDNVVLVFTRWEHSEKAERKRQRSGIYYHRININLMNLINKSVVQNFRLIFILQLCHFSWILQEKPDSTESESSTVTSGKRLT